MTDFLKLLFLLTVGYTSRLWGNTSIPLYAWFLKCVDKIDSAVTANARLRTNSEGSGNCPEMVRFVVAMSRLQCTSFV
jgi:hypothetical protein